MNQLIGLSADMILVTRVLSLPYSVLTAFSLNPTHMPVLKRDVVQNSLVLFLFVDWLSTAVGQFMRKSYSK